MLIVCLFLAIGACPRLGLAQTAQSYQNTMRLAATTSAVPAPALCDAQGGWLYAYSQQTLRVVDLTDPLEPIVRGTLDGLTAVVDLIADGDLLYLARGANGLLVVDVSDRLNPAIAGSVATAFAVSAVAPVGGLVAVAGGGQFALIDVSTPSVPTIVGQVATVAVSDLGVLGNHAFVAGDGGLATIDIATPTAPQQVGLFNQTWLDDCVGPAKYSKIVAEPGRIAAISIEDRLEYDEADDNYHLVSHRVLVTLDAGDPANLSLLGGNGLVRDPRFILVRGGNVVSIGSVATNTPARYLSVHQAGDMVLKGQLYSYTTLGSAAWMGRYLYVAAGSGLAIYDLQHPQTVLPFADWTVPNHDYGGHSERYYLVTRTSWSGWSMGLTYYFYDTSDPFEPFQQVSGFASGWMTPVTLQLLGVRGNFAVLEESNDSSPVAYWMWNLAKRQRVALPLAANDGNIAFAGSILWAVEWTAWNLVSLDYSGFPDVYRRAELALPVADSGSLIVRDDGAAIRQWGTENKLTLLDLNDPYTPILGGSVDLPGRPRACLFRGGYAYVACDGAGLLSIDVSDLQNPQIIGALPAALVGTEAAIHGDVALFASGGGFQLVSLADPGDPQLLSPIVAVPGARGIPVLRDHLVYAGHLHGLSVFDLSDPASPVFVGQGSGLNGPLYDAGNWLVAAGGAYPLDVNDGTVSIENPVEPPADPAGPPAALAITAVAPNPFNPRTTITFAMPRAARATLTVYDLSGRRVRTLADGSFAAGEHRIAWDGRSDRGNEMAGGVYLIRLVTGDGHSRSLKATLLK